MVIVREALKTLVLLIGTSARDYSQIQAKILSDVWLGHSSAKASMMPPFDADQNLPAVWVL
jgi:hypothetical protein